MLELAILWLPRGNKATSVPSVHDCGVQFHMLVKVSHYVIASFPLPLSTASGVPSSLSKLQQLVHAKHKQGNHNTFPFFHLQCNEKRYTMYKQSYVAPYTTMCLYTHSLYLFVSLMKVVSYYKLLLELL